MVLGITVGFLVLIFMKDELGTGGFVLFGLIIGYLIFYAFYLSLVESKVTYQFNKANQKVYRIKPYLGKKELMHLKDVEISAYSYKNAWGYRMSKKETSLLGKHYQISPIFHGKKGDRLAHTYENEILTVLENFLRE